LISLFAAALFSVALPATASDFGWAETLLAFDPTELELAVGSQTELGLFVGSAEATLGARVASGLELSLLRLPYSFSPDLSAGVWITAAFEP